ncbi:translation initiation factor eIF-2B subunit gamma [Schistocerca americana]|uniref:translation initiation factor eIF-2B subunit gamma n=1 Tax=Schistocerca americana TaxID=7009 RepID=UPI001F4F9C26|nr:translation initiation factor eIF-2B subunit gamma [Schistocerca americana]XP_046979409.1 translation initiation factor eIF-2B subunit gamma [Schistocerca americana]XP_046979410.1 translation initiation factor eIF-2B subunit gamma [Schistocerca americana]
MIPQEFQVVLLAGGKGSRMTELTASKPKCLLPIGNRPMIYYPLRMLEKAGFKEVIIVVLETVRQEVQTAVDQCGLKIHLDWVGIPANEDWGTAESLRHVSEKVKSDIIVMSSDLVTDFNLENVLDVFRKHQASIASVFFQSPPDVGALQTGPKQKYRPERDLVGIETKTSRLLFLASASDFEDSVTLPRALLRKHPRFSVYSHLIDSHIYVLKKWICDFLKAEKSFSTLKGEVIPYIVKKQLVKPLSQTAPDPNVSLIGMDVKKDIHQFSAEDQLVNEIRSMSTFTDHCGDMQPPYHADTIRCYGVVMSKETFGMRANTLAGYSFLNHKLNTVWNSLNGNLKLLSPTSTIKSNHIGSECIVGDATEIAEKTTLTNCIIGSNCIVQTKTKLLNCIIMNNVAIEEGSSLSNCILCDGVKIGKQSELKDCLLGSSQVIQAEAKHSNEVLTDTKRLMEI